MQGKHMKTRLLAGLMSLALLLSLLPAMSAPAEAADDFFTVSGTVNNGQSFTAQQSPMSDDAPTTVATIPTMYVGKNQHIQITASKDVTWSIVLGEQPKGLALDKGSNYWQLSGDGLQPVTARFLLTATPVDGSESRSIWIYCYCFNESDRPAITTPSLPGGNVGSAYNAQLSFNGAYNGWTEWEFASGKDTLEAAVSNGTRDYDAGMEVYVYAQPTATVKEGETLAFTVQPNAGLAVGTYTATVTVSDTSTAADAAEAKTFHVSFTVSNEYVKPSVQSASLPWAKAGDDYQYQFSASGTGPFRWSLKEGAPAWLSIDENTGLLTGTVPEKAAGSESIVRFTVQVANVNAESDIDERTFFFNFYDVSQLKMTLNGTEYTGVIENGRTILPDAYVGTQDMINNSQLTFGTGGSMGTIRLSYEGALPEGMGEPHKTKGWTYLELMPTRAGTYDFTVVAKQYADSARTEYVQESRYDFRITVLDRLTKENFPTTVIWEVAKAIAPST